MAQQTLNIGTTADDGTGDTPRVGGDKINDNFTELYDAIAALGTASESDTDDFATAAQGSTADSALQPGDQASAIVTESTTSRTLALTDAQKYIRCTNGSATTITVPPQTDVAWTAATEILIEQAGAGQVTIAAGSGVTIRTSQTLLSAAQYSQLTLKRVAEDEWVCGGDREAA